MANWRNLFANAPNHSLDCSLVAQFLDKPPSFSLLHRVLTKLWEKQGILKINVVGPNFFLFQFENENICNWILENGPLQVQHNTIILQKWEPNLGPISFDLDKLSIWFHLHRILLELYNRKGISYISSGIDTPLYMDSITAARKRLTYAKVCIEVSTSVEPPVSVKVKLRNGMEAMIPVNIPWKPLVCKSCSLFGHSDQNCTKGKEKMKHVWRPKESTNIPNETVLEGIDANDSVPDVGTCSENAKDKDQFEIVKPRESTGKRAKSVEQSCSRQIDSSGHKIDSFGPNGKKFVSNNSKQITDHQSIITCSSNKFHALCEGTLDEQVEEEDVYDLPVVEEEASKSGKGPCSFEVYGKKKNYDAKSVEKGPKSSQKLIGSSKNKLAMLCDDNSNGYEEEEDNLNDLPIVDPSNTIWTKLIENATFAVPKKPRAEALGAAQVLLDMKPKKSKAVAKGSKKINVPSSVGKTQ